MLIIFYVVYLKMLNHMNKTTVKKRSSYLRIGVTKKVLVLGIGT